MFVVALIFIEYRGDSYEAIVTSLQSTFKSTSASCWRWQRRAVLFEDFKPFINNLAEFSIDFGFVVAVAAGTDNTWTLADEALVFIRPFNDLDIFRDFIHGIVSSIFLFTSLAMTESGRHGFTTRIC
jgi:hypothetical protein